MGRRLSNAEQRLIAYAMARMGGGGAGIATPNDGFGVVGSTVSTSYAMVNLTAIYATLGIAPADAIMARADSNHPNYETVKGFLNNNCGGLATFRGDLQRAYGTMPDSSGDLVIDLPLPVVAELIEQRIGG